MLESFRKKESKPGAYPRPQSPYSEMQEALIAAQKAAEQQKTETKESPAQPEAAANKVKAEVVPADRKSPDMGDSISRLIVGPDIKLRGAEITDCDTLVVEGRVEASMDSRVIQIAEHGVFVGKVGIDIAEIRGRFEGDLTARKQLVIHSTGHVSGKIRYGKITVEEGGELLGDVASIANPKGAGSVTGVSEGKSEATNGTGALLKTANLQR